MTEDLTALFSADLTNVDISRTLLREGRTAFTVAKTEVVDTKDHSKKMLNITLKTRYEQLSTKGDKIEPGFTVIDRIVLTPTEDRPADRVMQDLKRLQAACGRSGPFGDPKNYITANLEANVLVESDSTGQYGDQNRVRYIPATAVK